MEMHQVRYFLAVSQTLNFTRAAEDCHVAQPSLTRAIKKLEEELGGDLFRRERTRTHLTELGQQMLPHLQQCYDSAISARALAQSLKKGTVSPLRIALSQTIKMQPFTPALNELVHALPGLALKLFRGTGEAVVEHLEAGSSEVALAGAVEHHWDRLDRWPLFEEPFALVMHKDRPLARRNEIDLADLAGETVFARPYCEQGKHIAAFLKQGGLPVAARHEINTDQDLIALLEADLGVAILPQSLGQSPSLRSLMLRGLSLKRAVYVYAVAGRQRSPAAAVMVKLLRSMDWSGIAYGQPAESARTTA